MPELRCPGCLGPLEACGEDRRACAACGEVYARRAGVWHLVPGFRPAGFPATRLEGLARLDEGHFWAEPRDALAERLVHQARPGGVRQALELGCGTGRFLARLAGLGAETSGVDGHPELLADAARRGVPAELLHADLGALPLADAQFDLVVALDVLEHVEPHAFLAEAARVLRPGAALVLSVPAFPLLWSRLDEAAGHRCRYTLAALRPELEAAGFRLEGWTHYQFLLFPLVLLSRWLGRRREVGMERRPPTWLGRLLGGVNRLEVAWLGGLRLPFGSSLLVRAVAPA